MPHPDDVISEKYRQAMNDLAADLDMHFNGGLKGKDSTVCFTLLVTAFDGADERVNYISNGRRADIILMLKHLLARFEGQPELKGRA